MDNQVSHSDTLHYSRYRELVRKDEICHPDDLEIVANLPVIPILTVLECHSYDNEFTCVRRTSSEVQFRMRTDALKPAPQCRFRLCQFVEVLGSDPVLKVQIHRIEWHVVRGHEVYYVIKNGRHSGRMYLPNELVFFD
jgi:hypothetical protein